MFCEIAINDWNAISRIATAMMFDYPCIAWLELNPCSFGLLHLLPISDVVFSDPPRVPSYLMGRSELGNIPLVKGRRC